LPSRFGYGCRLQVDLDRETTRYAFTCTEQLNGQLIQGVNVPWTDLSHRKKISGKPSTVNCIWVYLCGLIRHAFWLWRRSRGQSF